RLVRAGRQVVLLDRRGPQGLVGGGVDGLVAAADGGAAVGPTGVGRRRGARGRRIHGTAVVIGERGGDGRGAPGARAGENSEDREDKGASAVHEVEVPPYGMPERRHTAAALPIAADAVGVEGDL